LRDEEWEAELTELIGRLQVDPPRPSASDRKLERLERALVNWYYRATTPPRNDSESSDN
jgi:hypothetical protein